MLPQSSFELEYDGGITRDGESSKCSLFGKMPSETRYFKGFIRPAWAGVTDDQYLFVIRAGETSLGLGQYGCQMGTHMLLDAELW
jgi:hypothetical protein